MPKLSAFYGIAIYMYFSDHNPPHFHARYAGTRGRFRLDGQMIDGDLPLRARRLVREWALLHSDELSLAWGQASKNEVPSTIEPLS